MVVRVIGKDENKLRKATCKNCCSILEFSNADTVVKMIYDYTDDGEDCRFLKCPSCGEEFTVKMYG